MEKNELSKLLNSIDLFLIDIDDTLIPHLTVGGANKINREIISKRFFYNKLNQPDHVLTTKENLLFLFHAMFTRKWRLPKNKEDWGIVFLMLYYGIKLHMIKLINNFANFIHIRIGNACLINNFLRLLKKMSINVKDYQYTNDQIKKSLYPGVSTLLKKIKAKKIAMSESFAVSQYKSVLGIDEVYCNTLQKVIIKNSDDKYGIAKKLIQSKRSVGILMNDYEDESLLKLPNIKLVIMKNPPWRLRKKADITVTESYKDLF